jgi:carboxypeptidase family protein
MMRRAVACLAFALGLAAPSDPAAAQTGVVSGVVSGFVLADSARLPLEGADVAIARPARAAKTNASGAFRIADLAPGIYIVTVRAVGFTPALDTFELSAGLELIRRYTLKRATPMTVLDSVRVSGQARAIALSPEMRDFERRRGGGFGHFIAPDEMRKFDNRALAEVISQRVPGLRVITYNTQRFLASSRGVPSLNMQRAIPTDRQSPKECWPQIYMGNARIWYNGVGENVPNLDNFQIHEIGALEYYSGSATMPVEFNSTGSVCGTLVLHMREK